MKRYKVKQIVRLLTKRGWYLQRTRGDHRQFKNDSEPGIVTIYGKDNDTVSQELLNSIWKQAGWKK